MAAGDENVESSAAAGCSPLIEVVHAFGTCPDGDIRNSACMLDNARVAYTVGSRVAVVDGDPGGKGDVGDSSSSYPKLAFLSTDLRVARVTALACSADKRLVSVCYKAVDEPLVAYATVYRVTSCPRPSRAKTVSYKRRQEQPPSQQQRQQRLLLAKGRGGDVALVADVARHKQGGMMDGGSGRRHGYTAAPTSEAETNSAEFSTADFSRDGEHLALLDGAPAFTLLWFEWKTGRRLLTVEIRSPVHRIACSPSDGSKIVTAGAGGLLRIWNAQGGGKASSVASAVGSRELCYRDVAWLNGDRLVAAAHEGFVYLMSPGEVLQEWDVREGGRRKRVGPPMRAACDDQSEVSSSLRLPPGSSGGRPAGPHREGLLNVVAIHERGFFVGGMNGRLLVFEPGSGEGSGGSREDAYVLTRVVRLFATDLVELGAGKGSAYRWLLIGEREGEIGLVDTHQLFKNPAADGNDEEEALKTSTSTDVNRSSRQGGGTSRAAGAKLLANDAEGRATAPVAAAACVKAAVQPGEAIFRGFANAMDSFENALNVAAAEAAADAEPGSSKGNPKEPKDGISNALLASGTEPSGRSGTGSPLLLYRPVVRGLLGEGRTSLSSISLCARKPLLAVIARGVSTPSGVPSSPMYEPVKVDNDDEDGGGEIDPDGYTQNSLQVSDAAETRIEIQVWNYRTKRALVKYRFEVGSASGSGYGYAEGVGALPVAISLHPSGDSIAVAFPHFVNVFYIVGGGGEEADRGGEPADDALLSSPPWSSSSVVVAQAVAAGEPAPLATLRSDQREVLTRGMFSVAGEKDPIVNYDPVSAVHFSHGGHLLAVITGKVVQILSVHAGIASGRLGRVQTLSGHASAISSFHWGADDRRCWTADGGYVFEWEVGPGLGSLGADGVRRGKFISKRVKFEGIVADPALDGGVAACAIGDPNAIHANGVFNAPEAAVSTAAAQATASPSIHVIGGAGKRIIKPSESAGGTDVTTAVATETMRGQDLAAGTDADKTIQGSLSAKARVHASSFTRGGGAGGAGGVADGFSSSTAETSSLFVWPGRLKPTAEVAGLQARVPYRLTCVRVTPFEARFGGARNALLAGTGAGMVVAFDWGYLLRDAGKGRGSKKRRSPDALVVVGRKEEQKEDSVLPSAQMCLHSRPVNSLAVTADGNHFFTTASDGAIFMCKIQLDKRNLASVATQSSSAPKQSPLVCTPRNALSNMKTVRGMLETSSHPEGMTGKDITAAAVTGAGVSMASEACMEEEIMLMEEEAVVRLQAKAFSARRQLEQLQRKAAFESEKERRAHAQRLEALKVAGREESSRLEDKIEGLQGDLLKAEKQREDLVRRGDDQRKREASAIRAMYEKKLALQAESYIQLKVAYEELSQAARDDAEEMGAKAEAAERAHEDDKRESMQKAVEDHQVLSCYVEFVGAQYHKALEDEQQQHDKQLNVLRATEEVCQLEKARVRDEAKAEVVAAKKGLKMLSRRMDEGCTREVDTEIALAAAKETVEQLGARVALLEQEARLQKMLYIVRAKAQRLSEWKNMADHQKTAVANLEKLKKALTMQLVEQRSQLEEKEAKITKMRDKLARNAKTQKECLMQICGLNKELADKNRQLTGVRSELDRLKISLRHREVLLKTTATRVMSALDTATTKNYWLAKKKQLEGFVLPLLERDVLDGLDAVEVAAEQARQRDAMQETINKAREALRQEHQNNEQQNLLRVSENLELTRELNLARKRNAALEAKITQVEATIKFERGARRNKPSRATLGTQSVPDFRRSPLSSKVSGLDSTGSIFFRNLSAEALDADDGGHDEEARPSEHRQTPGGDTAVRQHGPKPSSIVSASDHACAGGAIGAGDAVHLETTKQTTSALALATASETGEPASRQWRSVPSLRNGTKSPRNNNNIPRTTPIAEGGFDYEQHRRAATGSQTNAPRDRRVSSLLLKRNSSSSSSSVFTTNVPGSASAESCRKLAHLDLRRVAYDTKPLVGPERARLSFDPSRRRGPSMPLVGGGGAGVKPGMMRVLLPGEGARDYTSLLKGTEALRVRELESRAATAEAEATRLAYENHRIARESKRQVATREAEAARAVSALCAELAKLRSIAPPLYDSQHGGVCTPGRTPDGYDGTTEPGTPVPRDNGSPEAKKNTDTLTENGDGFPSRIGGGSHGGKEEGSSTVSRGGFSQSSIAVTCRLPVPESVTPLADDAAPLIMQQDSEASSPLSTEGGAGGSEAADGATSFAAL